MRRTLPARPAGPIPTPAIPASSGVTPAAPSTPVVTPEGSGAPLPGRPAAAPSVPAPRVVGPPSTRGVRHGSAAPLLAAAVATQVTTGVLGVRARDLLRSAADSGWSLGSLPPTARVEDVVELAAVLAGGAVAAWFAMALSVAAVCVAARALGVAWLAGERLVGRVAPLVVRRALVLSAGAGVAVVGVTAPAVGVAPPPDDLGWAVTETQAGPPGSSPATSPTSPAPAGPTAPPAAPAPAAPVASPAPMTSPGPAAASPASTGTTPDTRPRTADGVVVVRPGDTLWGIARDHLPAGATVVDVATAWPSWYAANAEVVGPDPDLIRPGQRLLPPPEVPAPTTAPSGAAPGQAPAAGVDR